MAPLSVRIVLFGDVAGFKSISSPWCPFTSRGAWSPVSPSDLSAPARFLFHSPCTPWSLSCSRTLPFRFFSSLLSHSHLFYTTLLSPPSSVSAPPPSQPFLLFLFVHLHMRLCWSPPIPSMPHLCLPYSYLPHSLSALLPAISPPSTVRSPHLLFPLLPELLVLPPNNMLTAHPKYPKTCCLSFAEAEHRVLRFALRKAFSEHRTQFGSPPNIDASPVLSYLPGGGCCTSNVRPLFYRLDATMRDSLF
ncbi:hypothetical protein B0H11DRAFT_2429098 [Mycena galericulata]|nr:hypothetical protein B0H11DRAFT_2429098 [Mycena galericulata]